MAKFSLKLVTVLTLAIFMLLTLLQRGFCCQVDGQWCGGGDPPEVCCNEKEYECVIVDGDIHTPVKGDEMGTCERKPNVKPEEEE